MIRDNRSTSISHVKHDIAAVLGTTPKHVTAENSQIMGNLQQTKATIKTTSENALKENTQKKPKTPTFSHFKQENVVSHPLGFEKREFLTVFFLYKTHVHKSGLTFPRFKSYRILG